MKFKDILKILVFTSIGVGILVFLFRRQDVSLADLWASFRTLNPLWIGLSVAGLLVSHVMRALRWRMQIEALGHPVRTLPAFWAMMAGYAINYVVPRSGELLKCGWLGKREAIPPTRLVGTVVTERLIDVVCLGGVVAIAFMLEFDTLWGYLSEHATVQPTPVQIAVALSVGALVLLALFVVWRRSGESGIYSRIWEQVLHLKSGLLSIGKVRRPGMYVLLTVMIWAEYVLMHYVVMLAFGPTAHLGIEVGLMVFVFGSLGIIIPTPGGIGSFQALVTQALVLYGIQTEEAFIFSNIVFWPFVVVNIVLGTIGFLALSRKSSAL